MLIGKYYIGLHHTDNIDDGYLGSGKALKKALEKYGKENFKREILEYADTMEELSELEKKYVTLNEVNDIMCYNMKTGGLSGNTYSEESRKRNSEAQKGKTRKPLSDEHKQKICEANKGRPHLSRRGMPSWNKGIKMSDEFKEKCRSRALGLTFSDKTKKKMSNAHKLQAKDEEYKKHLSDAMKNWWKNRRGNMS